MIADRAFVGPFVASIFHRKGTGSRMPVEAGMAAELMHWVSINTTHCSGIPASRSPLIKVALNKACIFGTP